MKVVIVLPTYNERENIILLLHALREVFRGIKNHSISYLVVDDMSPDGTAETVVQYGKKYPDVSVIVGKKEGLGKALLRGMTYAVDKMGAEVILQMDADLSHDPKTAPKFLEAIDKGANFVVGSRYIPGGSIPDNWGFHRKIFSRVGNAIVRFGLGHPEVHDWTGGYRAYTKNFYEEIHAEVKAYSGYVFQIAFLHKAILRGAHITEVPIQFTDRRFGHSKIAPAEYIKNVLKYVVLVRMRGSFGKFLVVGGFGFIINAVLLVVLHEVARLPAVAANLLGSAAAIFSNYNFNNMWTFKHRKIYGARKYVRQLIFFYGTSVFGVVVIQTGTIWLGVHFVDPRYYFLYFLIGTGFLMLWNFTMYSKVIWSAKG